MFHVFYLDTCVASNIPVLLHCVHDWSRSQTLVCAWLMHSRHWTLDEAYHHILSIKLDARFDAMFYGKLEISNICKKWMR